MHIYRSLWSILCMIYLFSFFFKLSNSHYYALVLTNKMLVQQFLHGNGMRWFSQVPKGWDRLLVSVISIETGKTVAKSSKAVVRNGNCQWTEALSESIWVSQEDASKELEECLFKFVVSTVWFMSWLKSNFNGNIFTGFKNLSISFWKDIFIVSLIFFHTLKNWTNGYSL